MRRAEDDKREEEERRYALLRRAAQHAVAMLQTRICKPYSVRTERYMQCGGGHDFKRAALEQHRRGWRNALACKCSRGTLVLRTSMNKN